MPYSPQETLSLPWLPATLTHNTYCDVHAKQVSSHYNRYQRPKRSRPRYHRGWPKIRQRYLLHHPFCEMCLSQGEVFPSHRGPSRFASGTRRHQRVQEPDGIM
ncbi:hypothetical protein ACW18Q_09325 [Limosilactobacillus reuteri]